MREHRHLEPGNAETEAIESEKRTNTTNASDEQNSNAPDWEHLSFDVHCHQCDQNLRNHTDSQCPNCDATLDWNALVPAEHMRCPHCRYRVFAQRSPRCPECGQSFAWADVLSAARARRHNLFEHRWEDGGATALFRTWWLATFRPSRLWSQQCTADPPRIKPLFAFLVLQWAVFAVSWHVIGWLVTPIINHAATQWQTNANFNYRFRMGPDFYATAAVWYVAAFLALQIFAQTKKRYGISWPQTLRVFVHASAFMSLCMLLSIAVEVAIDTVVLLRPSLRSLPLRLYDNVQRGILQFGLLVTWAHLWIGYRRHLGVPRGWGTAAMALAVGYFVARVAAKYM